MDAIQGEAKFKVKNEEEEAITAWTELQAEYTKAQQHGRRWGIQETA